MSTNFGTNGVLDALAAFDAQNVLTYGEDRLFDDFQRSLDAHNAIVNDMLGMLAEDTTDRVRRYGVESRMDMLPADEYTRMDAQKAGLSGVDVGFPLRPYQITLQWTRKHLEIATVGELARHMISAQRADVARVRAEVQRALFTPTNNLTYADRFIDGVTIPVRALLNADSAAIPDNDFGVSFDGSSHTHYLATSSLAASNIESAVNTVVEHGVTGPMYVCINRAQEAAVTAMANFTAYNAPLTTPGGGTTGQIANGGPIAPFDIYNRAIGVWNGAIEVWVKPWVFANYIVVLESDPNRKPLARRTRPGNAGRGALRMVAQDERYPLRAETMEREFGIGVWGRDQAAVLYTGGASYTAPTITL